MSGHLWPGFGRTHPVCVQLSDTPDPTRPGCLSVCPTTATRHPCVSPFVSFVVMCVPCIGLTTNTSCMSVYVSCICNNTPCISTGCILLWTTISWALGSMLPPDQLYSTFGRPTGRVSRTCHSVVDRFPFGVVFCKLTDDITGNPFTWKKRIQCRERWSSFQVFVDMTPMMTCRRVSIGRCAGLSLVAHSGKVWKSILNFASRSWMGSHTVCIHKNVSYGQIQNTINPCGNTLGSLSKKVMGTSHKNGNQS